MKKELWAGVDIGGTKTAVVLSTNPPEVLARTEFPTLPARGPEPAVDQIKSSLRAALSDLGKAERASPAWA